MNEKLKTGDLISLLAKIEISLMQSTLLDKHTKEIQMKIDIMEDQRERIVKILNKYE